MSDFNLINGMRPVNVCTAYSHLSNKRGGWNKRGGGAKFAKSLNVEGGILWKKLMHNSNK